MHCIQWWQYTHIQFYAINQTVMKDSKLWISHETFVKIKVRRSQSLAEKAVQSGVPEIEQGSEERCKIRQETIY